MSIRGRLAICVLPLVAWAQGPAPAPAPLSAEVRARIDRMMPIFDGRTLDGWIQAPPYPLTISSSEITNPVKLAQTMLQHAGPVATLLEAQIEERDRPVFQKFAADGISSRDLSNGLARALNRLINGPALYDEKRFAKVTLRPATAAPPRG